MKLFKTIDEKLRDLGFVKVRGDSRWVLVTRRK